MVSTNLMVGIVPPKRRMKGQETEREKVQPPLVNAGMDDHDVGRMESEVPKHDEILHGYHKDPDHCWGDENERRINWVDVEG